MAEQHRVAVVSPRPNAAVDPQIFSFILHPSSPNPLSASAWLGSVPPWQPRLLQPLAVAAATNTALLRFKGRSTVLHEMA
jgi:hypothetical protein